jgi:hypothetical protein
VRAQTIPCVVDAGKSARRRGAEGAVAESVTMFRAVADTLSPYGPVWKIRFQRAVMAAC